MQIVNLHFAMFTLQFAMHSLDAINPDGLALRVEFIRRSDRYAHTISVVDQLRGVQPVLESVEGTATDDWPASPPLQNLSIEELAPGRRAALLVGMAGRNHWSASVEAVTGRAALVFDIACRIANDAGRLGSTYDVASRQLRDDVSIYYRNAQSELVEIAGEHYSLRVQAFTQFNGGAASLAMNRISIGPLADSRPKSSTYRWKYCVELVRHGRPKGNR
jgi:hypothetical protein